MRAEVFETFRRILHEGLIEKRTQYVIEQLFAVRRTEFEEYPRMAPELDLVEDGDQITHTIELNKEIDKEEYLDVFHVDPNFEENEETWKKIKMAILGEDESSTSSASEGEDENGGSDDDENNSDSEDSEEDEAAKEKSTFLFFINRFSRAEVLIEDQTDQDTTNLRRTVPGFHVSPVDLPGDHVESGLRGVHAQAAEDRSPRGSRGSFFYFLEGRGLISRSKSAI